MPRVVIVGAGLGGLALAHGLLRHGFDVQVLERETDLRRTVGHGVQLDAHAVAALAEMMPTAWWRRLVATGQRVWVETGYAVRDESGRLLAPHEPVEAPEGVMTDRVTLRLMLADGLAPQLRLGAEVSSHHQHGDGAVSVSLADGSRLEADLVVAADGVGSTIAAALAGRPTSEPSSLIGFAGRTPVAVASPATRALVDDGAMVAVGPGGCGLYAGRHESVDPHLLAGLGPDPWHREAAIVWGAVMLEWERTEPLLRVQGEDLRTRLADELRARRWSDPLVDLVARSEQEELTGFRFHTAAGSAERLAPWQPGTVTALGDAVHAMPPTGGMGASTAIRDAHVLQQELAAVGGGRDQLVAAVGRYERRMRGYAARVVTQARRPVAWVLPGPVPGGELLPFARERSLAAAAVSWSQRAAQGPSDL